MMQMLHKTEPWGSALSAGHVIWRPVAFSSISGSVDESCRMVHAQSIFKSAPKGGYMARVATPGCFIPELELVPATTKAGKARPGIVVFLDKMPSQGWTHLVVSGVASHLQNKPCTEMGGAIWAKNDKPYEMEDYAQFRVDILKAMMTVISKDRFSSEELFNAVSEIWPNELRPDLTRLMVAKTGKEDTPYAYDTNQDDLEEDLDEGDHEGAVTMAQAMATEEG